MPHVTSIEIVSNVGSVGNINSPSNPICVIGVGSAGAKSEWLPPQIGRNVVGIYTPGPDGVSVSFLQYLPTIEASIFWKGEVPLHNFYQRLMGVDQQ